jgi:hypothetical protein
MISRFLHPWRISALTAATALPVLFALGSARPAQAQAIPIPNGAFDAETLPVGSGWTNGFGSTTTNTGTPMTVSGWLSDDGNQTNATDGIHTFVGSNLFPNGGYNNTQVGYANSGTFTSSSVLATIQANTTYTLSVSVGHRSDAGIAANPIVRLLGNGAVITPTSAVTPLPNQGFVNWTLTYNIGAASPLVGQGLRIQLGTAGPQAQFDNVSLNAVSTAAAPEPASLGLLALGGAGLLPLVRRRRLS